MIKKLIFLAVCLILLHLTLSAQSIPAQRSQKPLLSETFQFGYNDGPGGRMSTTISNFTADWPLSLRFSLGYTRVEPGQPDEAREIFINDADNGVPEQRGWRWDMGLDFMLPLGQSRARSTFISFGPRHVTHTSNFKFVGGNEDFNVSSRSWGVGGGLETQFAITPRFNLTLGAGVDHFFQNKLYGHDTTYSPDDDNINPRHDYTYADADGAIEQPKNVLRLMLGIDYLLR